MHTRLNSMLLLLGVALIGSAKVERPVAAPAGPITLAMEDCKVDGPMRLNSDASMLAILFGGGRRECAEADG